MSPSNKHIDVAYILSRDYQEKWLVEFKYTLSSEMIADCMAKPLQKTKLYINISTVGQSSRAIFEREC